MTIPPPTIAPLAAGAGLAVALLSITFGPLLSVAAVLPLIGGARTWLNVASREWLVEVHKGNKAVAREGGSS